MFKQIEDQYFKQNLNEDIATGITASFMCNIQRNNKSKSSARATNSTISFVDHQRTIELNHCKSSRSCRAERRTISCSRMIPPNSSASQLSFNVLCLLILIIISSAIATNSAVPSSSVIDNKLAANSDRDRVQNTEDARNSAIPTQLLQAATSPFSSSDSYPRVSSHNGIARVNTKALIDEQQQQKSEHNKSHVKKLIKRSINGDQAEELEKEEEQRRLIDASISYSKFIARCCNNSIPLRNANTNYYQQQHHHKHHQLINDNNYRQQQLLATLLRHNRNVDTSTSLANDVAYRQIAKRDLANQLVSNSRYQQQELRQPATFGQNQQLLLSSLRLPTCHQLASLWTHMKSLNPSLAANLLSAVSGTSRPESDTEGDRGQQLFSKKHNLISKSFASSNYSSPSEQHPNILHLLSQAEKLIAQLESIAPADSFHYHRQLSFPQQQQQSRLDQTLRQHQLEKLINNPNYAKLLRRVQLREGINSRLISSGPEMYQEKAKQLNDNAIGLGSSQREELSQVDGSNVSPDSATQSDNRISPKTTPSSYNANNYQEKPENLVNEDYGFGAGVPPPNVTRKPPKHVSFGRIIYHPNESTQGNGQTAATSAHHETIDKLHYLHKFNEKDTQQEQQKQQQRELPKPAPQPGSLATFNHLWSSNLQSNMNPNAWSHVNSNNEQVRKFNDNDGTSQDQPFDTRNQANLDTPANLQIHKGDPYNSMNYNNRPTYTHNDDGSALTDQPQTLGLLDSLRGSLHIANDASSFSKGKQTMQNTIENRFNNKNGEIGEESGQQISNNDSNSNQEQQQVFWPAPDDARLDALDDKNLDSRVQIDQSSLANIKSKMSGNPNFTQVNWRRPVEVSMSEA